MKKMSLTRKVVASACSLALACAFVPVSAVGALADEPQAPTEGTETAATLASFTVNVTNATTKATTTTAYDTAKFEELIVTSEKPIYYVAKGAVYRTTSYVPASKLFGNAWGAGSTFNFTSRTKGDAIPYENVAEGKYYPNYAKSDAGTEVFDAEGAVEVPMGMGLDVASCEIPTGYTAEEAVAQADKDDAWKARGLCWVSGTSEALYTAENPSVLEGHVFWRFNAGDEVVANISCTGMLSSFTTTSTNDATGAVTTTSLDTAKLQQVTVTSKEPLYYLMNGTTIYRVTSYIPASSLLGEGWTTGSTFNFSDRGKGGPMTYEYDAEGMFFPNYANTGDADAFDATGAVHVPMGMGVDTATYKIPSGYTAAEAIEQADKDAAWTDKGLCWVTGTPESVYTATEPSTAAGHMFWSYSSGAAVEAGVNYAHENVSDEAKASFANAGLPYDDTKTLAENIDALTQHLKAAAQKDAAAVAKVKAKVSKTYTAKKKTGKLAKKKTVKLNTSGVTFAKAYSSSAKLTITKAGKVTVKKGLKKGTYTLVATATSGSASKTVTVTVKVK